MATSKNSSVTLIARGNIRPNTIAVGGGKGGVSNYELLTHKPSINGHELIGNKTNADLGIPTDTQDLTNTAGFITKIVDDLVNYYTKLEIDDIINQIKQTSFRIVDDLPLVGEPGVIYLILNSTPQSRNYYDEYIYVDNRWEKIGTTEIDLSGYVTDEELTQVLRNYITNETLNETLRNYYNKADVNLLLAGKANSADLAAVATSGSYDDLSNKPVIPNKLADLTEDTTHRTVTDSEKTTWNNKSDFSGSYEDLTNKPDIPNELADLSEDSTHRVVTDTEKETWNNKSDFSGNYNDLTDKPDIPTVYNSTITIKKNNQNIDSFTLNQSSNKSINMDVPEKTSDIQNDSGFITNTVNNLANYYLKSETYTKTEVSNLINAAVSGRFQKVNALPAQGEANVIYLVPKATVLVDNIYDEYIWEDSSWELIGDTQIDLSGYVTDADLTAALQNYVTSAAFNATISNYYTKTEVGNLLADKVDKVDGKGLSTYDYDASAKAIVDSVTANLATKVDKADGKGLSTNDYTTADKNKLAGIAANATKVESSETNGNIKIDTEETVVYDDSEIQEAIDTSLTEIDYANPLSLETMQAQLAKNTKVKIEPIQDLHGYSKPWVGGAGKNLLPMTVEGIKAASPSVTWNGNTTVINGVTFTILTDSDGNVTGIKANGNANDDATLIIYGKSTTSTADITFTSDVKASIGYSGSPSTARGIVWGASGGYIDNTDYTVTANSSVYGFGVRVARNYTANNIIFYPMIRLSTEIDSTFAPYSNICPISGHDQINVLGCGKNLCKWIDNKVINYQTGKIGTNNGYKTTDYIPVKQGQKIYITSEQITEEKWWYDKNKTPYRSTSGVSVKTSPIDGFFAMSVENARVDGTMIEYGETASTYEPYTESNNKTIVLPDTVYGGELDLESGELRVEKEICKVSDLTWSVQANSQYGKFKSSGLASKIYKTTTEAIAISEYYESRSDQGAILYNDQIYTNGSGEIKIRDGRYIDDADATAWVAACGNCKIVYRLADSAQYTLQLTPSQLYLLKNQNNLTTSQYTQIKVIYRNGVFAILEPVSEDNDGLMSRLDKVKLDSIADDATKTESSTTNGNIKINGTETQVYDDSEIKGELTTDTTTIEGNPLNFTTQTAQTAKSTILSVEPIQDLHGYDKPWVGGAGKNLLPLTLDILKQGNTSGTWNGNVYTTVLGIIFTVYVDDDGNVIRIRANGTATANADLNLSNLEGIRQTLDYYGLTIGQSYILNGTTLTQASDNNSQLMLNGSVYNIVDNGNGVTFTVDNNAYLPQIRIPVGKTVNNFDFYPMIRLSTETDPTFAPYTNICPISGRTEIGILGCGKNLLTSQAIELNGTSYFKTSTDTLLEAGTYTMSMYNDSSKTVKMIADKIVDGRVTTLSTTDISTKTSGSITFTLTETASIRISGRYSTAEAISDLTVFKNFQIEFGSTATEYEPYTPSNDLTISLGQTVYGGTLDVENGVLVVETESVTFDGSNDETIDVLSTTKSYFRISAGLPNTSMVWSDTTHLSHKIWSDKFAESVNNGTNSTYEGGVGVHYRANDSHNVIIAPADNSIINVQTACDWLSANPTQIVFTYTTPITIQLTPNEISLLEGVNNISTTADGIKLTYRDGKVATLGDLTSAVDSLDGKIEDSKILTDTATGDKYILVVSNGVLDIQQISN